MKKVVAIMIALALTVVGSVAGAQEKAGVQSDKGMAFLVDIEKTPGWMVYLEGGYQWNFFRGVGMEIRDRDTGNSAYASGKRNYTEGGAAGAIALGYNFCPKIPLTLGMKFGIGPSNLLEHTSADNNTYHWERVRLYTFDFALDYDIRNKSKFTPFVGINFGAALVSQKAEAIHTTAAGETFSGKYDTRRRINLMGGVRTGIKYDVNSRVALTLFGQYSYLGTIKSKDFEMSNAASTKFMDANTLKIKAHMVEAKLGIRIAF